MSNNYEWNPMARLDNKEQHPEIWWPISEYRAISLLIAGGIEVARQIGIENRDPRNQEVIDGVNNALNKGHFTDPEGQVHQLTLEDLTRLGHQAFLAKKARQ